MKKNLIEERIFYKHYTGCRRYILYSELPTDLLPTDKIQIEVVEGQRLGDEEWDDYTELIILRDREETDAEFEKRKAKWDKIVAASKSERYKQYLKLKNEFEPELKK